MQPRITGWERTSTDSVLARRFVRALFEGRAETAAELVAEDCVVHRAGCDDVAEGVGAIDPILEMVSTANVELETLESTVSDDVVVTTVTKGTGSTGSATSTDDECERTTFASMRVEDDRIVELWVHVESLGTDSSRSSGGLVSRVSAWLSTD